MLYSVSSATDQIPLHPLHFLPSPVSSWTLVKVAFLWMDLNVWHRMQAFHISCIMFELVRRCSSQQQLAPWQKKKRNRPVTKKKKTCSSCQGDVDSWRPSVPAWFGRKRDNPKYPPLWNVSLHPSVDTKTGFLKAFGVYGFAKYPSFYLIK